MGDKHDVLTESELCEYCVSRPILRELTEYQRESGLAPQQINVLDWGCGRGRSVAKLRERGFNAFGLEIDERTMRNGYELFRSRGYDPEIVLRHLDSIHSFEDGYFHFIFSEQVLEHVEDIEYFAEQTSRLCSKDAAMVHQYPGARTLTEVHLFMPLIHWLPKNGLRRWAIWFNLIVGGGPASPWPEVEGKTRWEAAGEYYQYSVNNTFYRDVYHLARIFEGERFRVEYRILGRKILAHICPGFLRRNGFPSHNVLLKLRRLVN